MRNIKVRVSDSVSDIRFPQDMFTSEIQVATKAIFINIPGKYIRARKLYYTNHIFTLNLKPLRVFYFFTIN